MQCPTCGEYGDLLHATIRKTGQQVIVCSECDLLWAHPETRLTADNMLDVGTFLSESGLQGDWNELEIVERLPVPAIPEIKP
ncbi:hypothetical protein [Janthinobacterium sp. UMAB-56]|uniref:hypothetical protein n=1 Tax=Janthinobacterium sp. UMAB-56 TaxID=1365361 RepID=UPI001C5A4C24|nr:hypothetical protein [Janthinobacterium sp. UMAB-56]